MTGAHAMKCPSCNQPSLVETMTKGGVLVEICKTCKGVWLDRGEVFFFSRKPRELERLLASELHAEMPSSRECPRCQTNLTESPFLRPDLLVDRCPQCEGYWFDAGELDKAMESDRHAFQLETDDFGSNAFGDHLAGATIDSLEPTHDERAHLRIKDLSTGMLPLPNLAIRSAGVVVLLYGLLGLILITLASSMSSRPAWRSGSASGLSSCSSCLGPG